MFRCAGPVHRLLALSTVMSARLLVQFAFHAQSSTIGNCSVLSEDDTLARDRGETDRLNFRKMALALDPVMTGPRALDCIRRAAGLAQYATRSPARCLDPSVAGWRSLHRRTGEPPFGEGRTRSHGRRTLVIIHMDGRTSLESMPSD